MSLIAILGIIIGALLGLTGAGGGILAVPALAAGLGWSMQQAAPVALIAVSLSATLGALDGLRRRLLRWRGALLMAAAGAPVTWISARMAIHLSQSWLQALFGAMMLIVSVRMLLNSMPGHIENEAHISRIGQVDQVTGRFNWNGPTIALLAGIGCISGLLTGLLGVGGGFIMVPLLRRYTNVSMHAIVATTLAVIALVGSAGVLSMLARGTHLPLPETALFALSCAVGMLGGRKLAHHLSASMVQRGFAMLLLVIAAHLLWQAMPGLL